MRRFAVVALGVTLAVSTAARGQTLREQLRNSGNPSGSTCPIRILADYGKRVAAEEAAKEAPKAAWETGGDSPAKAAGHAGKWESGSWRK